MSKKQTEIYTINVTKNPKGAALAILNDEVAKTTTKNEPSQLTIEKKTADNFTSIIGNKVKEMLNGTFPSVVLLFLLVLKRELTEDNYLNPEPNARFLLTLTAIALLSLSAFVTLKLEQNKSKQEMKQKNQLKELQALLPSNEESQDEFESVLTMSENEELLYKVSDIVRHATLPFIMILLSVILPIDYARDRENFNITNASTLAISLLGLFVASTITYYKTKYHYEDKILRYFEGKGKKKESADTEDNDDHILTRLIDEESEETLLIDDSNLPNSQQMRLSK